MQCWIMDARGQQRIVLRGKKKKTFMMPFKKDLQFYFQVYLYVVYFVHFFYLSLKQFHNADTFFYGHGLHRMEDIPILLVSCRSH